MCLHWFRGEIKIFIYGRELKRIEKEAKESGEWLEIGLDSNQHLFKKLNDEVKKKRKWL